MKTLYTSNYARNGTNPKALSISATVPSYLPNIGRFPLLAPSKALLYAILNGEITQDQYDIEYMNEILNVRKLDPVDIVAQLDDGAILLCYEKPTDHCHRHLVRDWLNNSGAAEVFELYSEKEKSILGLDVQPMTNLFVWD